MPTSRVNNVADAPFALPQRAQLAVANTIARTSLGAEKVLCLIRIFFFSVILLRFYFVSDHGFPENLVTIVPLTVGMLFSLFVLLVYKQPPRSHALWYCSVTLDAAVAFFSLLPNILWAGEDYLGLHRMPDLAGYLLAIVVCGFRLSPWVALWGGALNGLGLWLLLRIDQAGAGASHQTELISMSSNSMYFVFVGSATLVSVLLALVVRRIASQGAIAAVRADRAEQGLGSILADHHDLKSLLASAQLNADLVVESSGKEGTDRDSQLTSVAHNLKNDLKLIRNVVRDVKDRALGDLTALATLMPVEQESVIKQVAQRVQSMFPQVCLKLDTGITKSTVQVAGGEPTLHRILLNLLVNACEGHETKHATRVVISTELDNHMAFIQIRVVDDGPGFPETILRGEHHPVSGKPHGLGAGLRVVRGLVEASGGRIRLENLQPHGARATLSLRLELCAQESTAQA